MFHPNSNEQERAAATTTKRAVTNKKSYNRFESRDEPIPRFMTAVLCMFLRDDDDDDEYKTGNIQCKRPR